MSIFIQNSKAEIIINESDIDDAFESVNATIVSNTQKSLGKGSGWIIDSVIDYNISISKYSPFAASSYSPLAASNYKRLPKELDHPGKGLINIQNNDENEWFK